MTRSASLGLGAALAVSGLVALLAAPACSSGSASGACGFSCDGGTTDGSLDGMGLVGADHGAPKSLAISPAGSMLVVTDPTAPPTAPLAAQATYTDGTTSAVHASWSLDRIDIAAIGAGTGLVSATGAAFGAVHVTASALGLKATTTITVSLQATVNASNISPGDVMQLAGATAKDPFVQSLAYPYDKTVFPQGLVPPEMMWNQSSPGDEYSIHFTAPSFDLTVLTTADPPSRYTLPAALWNALSTTASGGDVTIDLRRFSGGVAYLSAQPSWHIAAANLRGLVYYWNISQGAILKADPTVSQVSSVFDPGPNTSIGMPPPLNQSLAGTPPWEDNGLGKRCVACHAVSKDGSTLTAVFSTGGSQGPLGFVGLKSTTVSAVGDVTAKGMLSAIVPDGSYAVMNTADKHMQLVKTGTATGTASALDALTNACDPAFSPDGQHFAFATNCTGGSGLVLDFSSSDLAVLDFTQSSATFGNQRTILTSGAAGAALAFPSFSPDSSALFFQGGDYSRAKHGTNLHGADDLYVVPVQPGATPIALDAANGAGVLPSDSLHLNYAPTTSPVVQGGYVWVVFTSPRDYGNRMASPQQPAPMDATYANHKQLWVAAVDAKMGTTDPSHPAFWLPGQDATSANMFGYWTLAPCKATQGDAGPQTCASGFECCSGFCRDNGSGPVCTDNAGGCHELGEVCGSSSDCCNAGATVACVAQICQSLNQ